MSLKKIQEVIIVHPINRLKEKIRPKQNIDVYITEEKIKELQNSLDSCHDLQEQEQNLLMQNIRSLWDKIKESPEKNNHCLTMFFIYINRLDDLSSIFSNEVIQSFIKLLKTFLQEADIQLKKHRVIIQAHLDVINLAHKQKIELKNSKDAQDLHSILEIAIQQNTN